MIADANWRKRISLMQKAEEAKEEEIKQDYDKLMTEYQELLKGEDTIISTKSIIEKNV